VAEKDPVLCAWCGQVVHYSRQEGTHTICRNCKAQIAREIAEQERREKRRRQR
jgi:hypothetical protein